MEPGIITLLSVLALVGMQWQVWQRYKPRPEVVVPDAGALLAHKREQFTKDEREWLLAWIETRADQSIEDVRKRWWAQYAYWCIDGLDERQQKQLEDRLVYWTRRRVENLSQYGPGGWEGTGWQRRS